MPSREERKKQLTRQRREQILDAALGVFSETGYDRASVPEIARRAGIAVGTIYNYFPSKKDILTALMEHHIIEPVQRFIDGARKQQDESILESILENRLRFSLTSSGKFIPIFLEVQRDTELRERYRNDLLKPMLGRAEGLIRTLEKSGNFRDIDPATVTRVITAVMIGMAVLYRTEGETSPLGGMDPAALAKDVATILLDGLRK